MALDKRVAILGALLLVIFLALVLWRPSGCAWRREGFMTGAPPHAKDLVIKDASGAIVYNNARNVKTAKVINLPVRAILDKGVTFPYDDDVTTQENVKNLEDSRKRLAQELVELEAQIKKKGGKPADLAAAVQAVAKDAKAVAQAATTTAAGAANKAAAGKPGSKTTAAASKTAAVAAKAAASAAKTAAKAKAAAKTAAKAKAAGKAAKK